MLRRRQILRGTLGVLSAAALPAITRAQTIIASQPLADDLYLFQGAGQNVIVARERESLLLVDGGSAMHAPTLLETLGNQFDFLPIRTLVNTHGHPEQTGLNVLLGSEGTEIIAHENTHRRLTSESAGSPSGAALPNTLVSNLYELPLRRETVSCGHLPLAHTDGDLYVHFPRRNVLVAGGALSTNGWPVLDAATGAWLGGLTEALASLAALADDETWIVPATGLPVRRADLLAQHARYRKLLDDLMDLRDRQWSIDQVLAANPLAGEQRIWPDGDSFLRVAWASLDRRPPAGDA